MKQVRSSEWTGAFKQHRLRLTKPRQLIVDVLGATSDHLSAEEVYLRVHPKYARIGLTTVYRTLDVLVRMGIVSRLDFGDARSRYELVERSGKPSHHHHLVCSSCKRVVEYDDFMDEEVKLIKKLEKALSRKHGFGITGHVVQFLGLCPACKTLARA